MWMRSSVHCKFYICLLNPTDTKPVFEHHVGKCSQWRHGSSSLHKSQEVRWYWLYWHGWYLPLGKIRKSRTHTHTPSAHPQLAKTVDYAFGRLHLTTFWYGPERGSLGGVTSPFSCLQGESSPFLLLRFLARRNKGSSFLDFCLWLEGRGLIGNSYLSFYSAAAISAHSAQGVAGRGCCKMQLPP